MRDALAGPRRRPGSRHRALGGQQSDSHDNALAGTINGLYAAELIYRRAPWKTKEVVELATLEWVSWFNHHRLLELFLTNPKAMLMKPVLSLPSG